MYENREIEIGDNGRYLLEVRRKEKGEHPFIWVSIDDCAGARRFAIPSPPHVLFVVDNRRGPVRLQYDGTEVADMSLRKFSLRDVALLRHFRRMDRAARIEPCEGLTLMPLLVAEGREGRELRRALKYLRGWGIRPEQNDFHSYLDRPVLADSGPWRPENGAPQLPRLLVALHLHYRDLWPEFEFYLRQFRRPFHLIVTTTENDPAFEAHVSSVFPGSDVLMFGNRGRDIGPFFRLLNEGRFDACDLICKLHGKKSGGIGRSPLIGNVWRRANLLDLIGSTEQVEKIVTRFATEPAIGMIGASRFRIPSRSSTEESAWAENKRETLRLAKRAGIAPDVSLDFFAGTMFWVRRNALEPLRLLDLRDSDFPEESGAMDGEIQHALERLFGIAVKGAGFSLENAPAR